VKGIAIAINAKVRTCLLVDSALDVGLSEGARVATGVGAAVVGAAVGAFEIDGALVDGALVGALV
jgi:hypothetical protein